MAAWILEGLSDDGSSWQTEVETWPFLVGRRPGCGLRLASVSVSSQHAELRLVDDALVLRDLGSTNGTFVNFERVTSERSVFPGEVIHFADREFRVVFDPHSGPIKGTQTISSGELEDLRSSFRLREAVSNLVRERQVDVEFQPVVRLQDRQVVGYECLGRGSRKGSPRSPEDLYAAVPGLEQELSELFREEAGAVAETLPPLAWFFVNTHPVEVAHRERLMRSLIALRERIGDRRLIVEIHEMAVTDLQSFSQLRSDLADAGMEIAFDDFGKGQGRFRELSEFAPSFVKFDRLLIENLDSATAQRRDLVRRLVEMVQEIGAETVAEGIETEGEWQACLESGFEFAQGYLLGRPEPSRRPAVEETKRG